MMKISEKMNILVFMTDAMRADHLECAGNPNIKTPNLNALASEGVRFSNCICSSPMCMPVRATFYTGKYPSVHGVRCNGINLNPIHQTFVQTLHQNGYHTASFGKIHTNWYAAGYSRKYYSVENGIYWLKGSKNKRIKIPENYYGFEEIELAIGPLGLYIEILGHYVDWLEEKAPDLLKSLQKRKSRLFENVCYESPVPAELHHNTYITERTLAFLERYSKGDYGEKPFFAQCSYPDPHHPCCPPSPYYEMYNPEDMIIPPSFEGTLKDHPVLGPALKNPIFSRVVLHKTNKKELRNFLAYTYGTITMIDHCIGQVLAALNSFGLSENTIVMFMSDHGDLGGDKHLLFKGPAHYRGLLNVPLIWKVPGITPRGGISDSLASTVDLPITILNLLNIKEKDFPEEMQGQDLTPILKDPKVVVRDHVIVEEDEELPKMLRDMDTEVRVRTMITETYRITIYQGYNEYGEIFDLKNDPYELNNLWFDDNSKELKSDLLNKFVHEILNLQSRYPKKEALT
jgi:arylsulfatase A-like enzyme